MFLRWKSSAHHPRLAFKQLNLNYNTTGKHSQAAPCIARHSRHEGSAMIMQSRQASINFEQIHKVDGRLAREQPETGNG
jgi:hypothetical protein